MLIIISAIRLLENLLLLINLVENNEVANSSNYKYKLIKKLLFIFQNSNWVVCYLTHKARLL